MPPLLQQFTQRQVDKATLQRDEALKILDTIQPVIVNGYDVTSTAREEAILRITRQHDEVVETFQNQSSLKILIGKVLFYNQLKKARKSHKLSIDKFMTDSAKAERLREFDRIEQAAGRISQEDIDRLLSNPRLSHDTKRVINDMRKTSLEASGAKSHLARSQQVPYGIQQHIWDAREIALFEQTQNQPHSSGTGTLAQQNVAMQQGLSVPPWMAHASTSQPEQIMVQDPVAPTRGKHRRMGTFGNDVLSTESTSSSLGGSSGYDASSSSHGSISFCEDDLADIDSGKVFDDLVMALS